jgi:hypothetical protein
MRRSVHCLAILAALIAFAPAARAAEPVDLLLVLAADVSRSVDATKFQLQHDGYAAAIANPRVLDAIRSGRNGKIAVAFVEWSGFGNQKVVIDWTAIDGPKAAQDFGTRLLESPLPWNPEHTNPPGGLANYYRNNVTGGPGSFVLEAKNFNSFGEAIIKKLVAEIADARPAR